MNFKLALLAAACVVFQDAAKAPDPLCHLSFDEQKAGDAKTVGAVAWAEGRVGGALKLDGAGAYVELPSTPALDKAQEGSYSISVWFRPEDVPPGTEADNRARYGIVLKAGWHCGLSYNHEKQFVMEHWLAPAAGSDEPVWAGAGTWEDSFDAGKWYHVVGVVDRTNGATKLYLNGELKNSADWEAGKAARGYAQMPWRVGIGSPGAEKWSWPAKGLIDEVRIHSKALSDAEVAQLFKAAK